MDQLGAQFLIVYSANGIRGEILLRIHTGLVHVGKL